LRENAIELVQSHGLLPNILSRLAAKKGRTKFHVSTIHLALELARGGRDASAVGRFKSRFYRFLDNRTSRISKRIVCVSDYVRRDQIEQGVDPEKLVTIRNGIDLSRFDFIGSLDRKAVRESLGVPAGAPVVGTVARMSPQKDVATLVRAMPGVWCKHPEARLILVGTGPLENEVKALAAEIGDGRIIFTGYRSDAHEIMAAMDVFCLPSLHEGLPLVVLEAMACGLPVVCSPVPGTLEAVVENETAFISPFGDHESFAENISRLLDNAELRGRMGLAGRGHLKENFTAERMVRDTLDLYQILSS
ncbi:MAG: glycosyltransferase family 4 protein, partial [Planctomycetes bacterium]|nr:glycosyltransferase family 4 protein [Planctomycetota bacterium]